VTGFITRYFWFLFGGIWLVVGLGLTKGGINEMGKERRYRDEGRVARATVTDKSMQRADRDHPSTRYVVSYRFTTDEGRPFTGRATVEVHQWESLREGDPITVTYLATAPETQRLGDPNAGGGAWVMVAVGLFFAGAGGGIVFWNWRRLAHDRHLRRTGVLVQGTVMKVVPTSLRINRVPQWQVVYRYQDHIGQTHETCSRALPPSVAHTWHPGDTGPVRFDRANPADSLWVTAANIGHASPDGGEEALPEAPG
jgi:Protein of unknown function (DUF3592)